MTTEPYPPPERLVASVDGCYYVCAACHAPIVRGDRCVCWRGWIVTEVDPTTGRPFGVPQPPVAPAE